MTHKFYKRIVSKKVVAQRFGDSPPDPEKHGRGWVEAKETDADVVAFRNSVSVRLNEVGEVVEVLPTPVCPPTHELMPLGSQKLIEFRDRCLARLAQ